jgi:hypothetical protein
MVAVASLARERHSFPSGYRFLARQTMDLCRDFDDIVSESGRRQNNTIIMVKRESARPGVSMNCTRQTHPADDVSENSLSEGPFHHVKHLACHLVSPEARHQIDPLHFWQCHQFQQQLLGHLDTFFAAIGASAFHAS